MRMPVDPLMLLKSPLCLSGVRRRTLHLRRTSSFRGEHHHGSRHHRYGGDQVKVPTRVARTPEEGRQVF